MSDIDAKESVGCYTIKMIVYQTKVRKTLDSLLVTPDPWLTMWLYSEIEKSPEECFFDLLNRIQPAEQKRIEKEERLVMTLQQNDQASAYIVVKNKKKWKLSHYPQEYKVLQHIGEGRFGSVDIVQDVNNGESYIRKYANKNVIGVESLIDEARILARISKTLHVERTKNGSVTSKVVQFYKNDHDVVEQRPFILLNTITDSNGTLVKTKDLRTYVTTQKSVKLADLITVSIDILMGIVNIHKCNIVHRDLHHGNIILYRLSGRLGAYIIDFGSSCDANVCDTFGPKGFTPNEFLHLNVESVDLETLKSQDVYAAGVNLFRLWHAGNYPLTRLELNADIPSNVAEYQSEIGGKARVIDDIIDQLLQQYSTLGENDLLGFIEGLQN